MTTAIVPAAPDQTYFAVVPQGEPLNLLIETFDSDSNAPLSVKYRPAEPE